MTNQFLKLLGEADYLQVLASFWVDILLGDEFFHFENRTDDRDQENRGGLGSIMALYFSQFGVRVVLQ